MVGYVFTYGVDGFGADTAPAHEEGVYLNYDAAFKHLCELNEPLIEEYWQNGNIEGSTERICQYIYDNCDEPPLWMYSMEEIEIHE